MPAGGAPRPARPRRARSAADRAACSSRTIAPAAGGTGTSGSCRGTSGSCRGTSGSYRGTSGSCHGTSARAAAHRGLCRSEDIVVAPDGAIGPGDRHRIPFLLNEADIGSDVILLPPTRCCQVPIARTMRLRSGVGLSTIRQAVLGRSPGMRPQLYVHSITSPTFSGTRPTRQSRSGHLAASWQERPNSACMSWPHDRIFLILRGVMLAPRPLRTRAHAPEKLPPISRGIGAGMGMLKIRNRRNGHA
jgi:hypothetical protein